MKNWVWKFDINDNYAELLLLEDLCGEQTFDQISECLPNGVYTTFRTYYHNFALRLDDHFQHLEHSAALVNFPIRLERTRLRNILRQIINHFLEHGDRMDVFVNLLGGHLACSIYSLYLIVGFYVRYNPGGFAF